MKPLTELTPEEVAKIKLVCFDVDGVTIKKGTDIKEVKSADKSTLTVTTSNLDEDMLGKILELKKYFIVAINSGRSSMYLTKVFYDILWDNAALISENGIFTLYEGELLQLEKFSVEMLAKMRNVFLDLKKLEGKHKDFRAFEPKQLLITLHAWADIPEVHEIVKRHDKEEQLYCWWNGEAFDIAPRHLNKGTGLKNLAKHLGIDLAETMAIGNGSNDKDMTDLAGIGVTTEPAVLPSDYHTTKDQHLGGGELIDVLLDIKHAQA